MTTITPHLTNSERFNIARELVSAAGAGNPSHETLHRDIDRAYFLAANSPSFRQIVGEVPTTRDALTIRVYVAGPMSGIAEHNVPAFDAAAAELRAAGFAVVTPPEITRSLGRYVEGIGVDGSITEDAYRFLVRRDLAALLECDAMVMLPGWRKSKGGRVEYIVAVQLGIPVYTLAGILGRRPLPSVDAVGNVGHGHAIVQVLTPDEREPIHPGLGGAADL